MPQAHDNRIPLAHPGSHNDSLTAGNLGRDKNIASLKEDEDRPVAPEAKPQRSQTVKLPSHVQQHPGLFPFDWRWQLAGLIAAIVSGIMLMGFSFHPEWHSFPVVVFLSGLGLLVLSAYCAVKTNWLQQASSAPLAVRVGTGTVIISGLIPIGAAILYAALAVAAVALMIWLMIAILGAAFSGGK